jgi:hypothetical protein
MLHHDSIIWIVLMRIKMLSVRVRIATATATYVAASLLLAAGVPQESYARERGPRVEVLCPFPPLPVRVGQDQVLAYELHITNFDTAPLQLTRVEVFGSEQGGQALTLIADDALKGAMLQVGTESASAGGAEDARIIAAGARAVLYSWIALPADRATPVILRHRMSFARDNGKESVPSTLEGLEVPVKHGVVPVLSPPFAGGTWLAGDGPANDSPHRRGIFAIDGNIYSPERLAIDWVKVGANGDSHRGGDGTRNEDWWGYGEPVLAVADGQISKLLDGIPDNAPRSAPPATLDNIAGNYAILQVASDRYVTYAHLQNASIRVRLRQRVHRGEVLALLGNSGNTTGAHLHFQVTDRNSVLESQGVPFVLSSFTYLGPGATYEPDKHATEPRVNSLPPGNGVVKFGPSNPARR